MKGLWGEEEANRVLADRDVNTADPKTDHARIIADMARKARRFELPDDPDPVISRMNSAAGELTGNN
jgi:hypothetical protein